MDANYIAYLKRALVKVEHRLANPLPGDEEAEEEMALRILIYSIRFGAVSWARYRSCAMTQLRFGI